SDVCSSDLHCLPQLLCHHASVFIPHLPFPHAVSSLALSLLPSLFLSLSLSTSLHHTLSFSLSLSLHISSVRPLSLIPSFSFIPPVILCTCSPVNNTAVRPGTHTH